MGLRAPVKDRLNDFVAFSRLHIESRDIDPVYPVLNALMRNGALWPPARRVDMAVLYVAFYNLASAWAFGLNHFRGWEADYDPDLLADFPTGVERRSLRGGKNMVRHFGDLDVLQSEYGNLRRWLMRDLSGEEFDHGRNWLTVQGTIREAWGNGRWAAYKLAEVLKECCAFPLRPSDMGNAGSTGPRKGLQYLWGSEARDVTELDDWGGWLQTVLGVEGIEANLAHVETLCCDFYSMSQGRYYVGHDIDHMQEQLAHPSVPEEVRRRLELERRSALPNFTLGELGGWHGVDKELKTLYARTGRIEVRWGAGA